MDANDTLSILRPTSKSNSFGGEFPRLIRFGMGALFCFALFLCGCKQELPGTKLLGKPLDIQFKAVDGRDVNLSSFRGKVVLIEFWATWCPPCVKELPNVQAAYEKFHKLGFEIMAISLDDKKQDLVSFVERNKMEWPQFFDEQGEHNRIAVQFGVDEIPAMWLVDRQGRLRDVDAVEKLAERVEKLLAENGP